IFFIHALSSSPRSTLFPYTTLFRSTSQWFISMEAQNLRQRALEEIGRTRWIPAWGRDRIYNMIAQRPDWCISRQRSWGVSIPARSEEHTSELQSRSDLVCRLLLEKK